jgi:hypothetical protein
MIVNASRKPVSPDRETVIAALGGRPSGPHHPVLAPEDVQAAFDLSRARRLVLELSAEDYKRLIDATLSVGKPSDPAAIANEVLRVGLSNPDVMASVREMRKAG